MPNRMLRDWTGSDKINKLSVYAERFFTRLIMKVDDFGLFYADVRLIRANLFPLKLDETPESDLLKWMAECRDVGLIIIYENTGKKYLQILDFKQRLDKARAKYPLPTNNDSLPIVNDFPVEVEQKYESEQKRVEAEKTEKFDLSNSNLYRNPVIPNYQRVLEVFVIGGGNKEMAEAFFNKNSGLGWYLNGSPITNFSNLVPNFIKNWKSNEKINSDKDFSPKGPPLKPLNF